MTPSTLTQTLQDALRDAVAPTLCVGFSGGPDSTALLHALAQLPAARARNLRAVHVDHGLHPDSAAWAERCRDFCAALDVPLTVVRVDVDNARGEGLEAAARRARHAAFADQLHDGEWLALAHHRDDQIETILLKLLRGAGPEGLGGMRALRPFARGMLWRPLLDTPRAALCDHLTANALSSIDDPANADPRFARNVLRSEILPHLANHWPHADAALLHSARLCRDAASFIDAQASAALTTLRREGGSLDAAGWLALPAALRAPVLDAWLRARGFTAPPDGRRTELERQAAAAAGDTAPQVGWDACEVRVWDGRLHALPPLRPLPDAWHAHWDGTRLTLPGDAGTLEWSPIASDLHATPQRVDPPLEVRLRRGGERIKPAGDAHTRELRDLFQQARMPPWLRTRCPLLYVDDALVAVADLWTTARGKALFDAARVRPHWTRPVWCA